LLSRVRPKYFIVGRDGHIGDQDVGIKWRRPPSEAVTKHGLRFVGRHKSQFSDVTHDGGKGLIRPRTSLPPAVAQSPRLQL